MLKKLSIFSGFKRITTSKKYIPEIDGIRFVAILLVVLYHISLHVQAKDTHIYRDQNIRILLEKFLFNGHLGVQIFFALSGFILSIPFASHFLSGSEMPTLKKFYLRRVTRLEPPYIIMLAALAPLLFIAHRFSGFVLLKSFFASLTYTHNFFYPGTVPFINGVAWSLEVEFQFYLLAPFLAYVFSFQKNIRRPLLVASILCLVVLQSFFPVKTTSLYLYLQYFLLGFLFADFYITKDYKTPQNIFSIPLGLLSLLSIMLMPHDEALFTKIFLIISISIFFYVALFSSFWKRILSIPFISTVGGMCYSIYLLHFPIIKIIVEGMGKRLYFSNSFLLNYLIINIFLLTAVLLISALFYKKIERPCMKADWYIVLWNRLRKTNPQS